MNPGQVYRRVLAVLVVATALAAGGSIAATSEAPPEDPESGYRTTVDGVRYTVHPSKLVDGCLGGRDCIPSIDDPRFAPAEQVTALGDDELVIGIRLDGEAKAYPLRILWSHEIVNDELADRPIAVTYCPLCRSGLVFSRQVGDRTLTFGVSGKLLNANLVMYDRQTGTYWSQIRAAAIVGQLVPAELTILPSTITTWDEWRSAHPETQVLKTGLNSSPSVLEQAAYESAYQKSDRVGYGVKSVDSRLRSKRIVYGVSIADRAKAYPADVVRSEGVINDELAGQPVVVLYDRHEGGVKVFLRNTSRGPITLAESDGGLVDEHGHRWADNGTALAGPQRGEQLRRVNTHGYYWFAWSEFNPETEIYGETAAEDDRRTE